MNANRSRYLPPSEAEERELSAESPDETLAEMYSRADTLDEAFKQQSAAAWWFTQLIKNKRKFGISPTIEQVIELQDALESMVKSHKLCGMCQEEIKTKRDEEMAAIKEKAVKTDGFWASRERAD